MLIRRSALGDAVVSMALAWIASAPAFSQPDRPPAVETAQRAAPRFVQRVYDLATLLAPVVHQLRTSIDPWPGSSHYYTLTEPLGRLNSIEQILSLIKTNVAEDTWNDPRTMIEVAGGDLLVVQTSEVHAQLDRLIAYLSRVVETQVAVDGTIALVDDALLEEWRVGAGSPAVLADAAAKSMSEALEKGERARRIQSLRAVARIGQRVFALAAAQKHFVYDYDVETASGAAAMAPQRGSLLLGAMLDICPLRTRGHLACDVRFSHQEAPVPIPRFETGIAGMGPLELPETAASLVHTTVLGKDGQTLLAGRVAVADPAAPRGAPARSICFFVRMSRVPAKEAEAPAGNEKRQVRLFDVGLLIEELPNYYGGNLGFGPVQQGNDYRDYDEVFVCGTCCQMSNSSPSDPYRDPPDYQEFIEPRGIAPEKLVRSIRKRIEPDTWEDPRNAIDMRGRFLYVRQVPAALDAVGKCLDEIAARRFRMIVTRVDLLAVDAAAYRAFRETYPALGAGSMRLEPSAAADILARAAKGDGLTLAASGEVAGLSRQLVYVKRAFYQFQVSGYNAVKAALVACHDPEVSLLCDGAIVSCRPALEEDGTTIHAELRLDFARFDRPIAVGQANEKGLRIHLPALSKAPLQATLVAPAGEPMLVGLGGPVRLDGAEKYLLAIVRLTPVTD
jgi:hypothetical protein